MDTPTTDPTAPGEPRWSVQQEDDTRQGFYYLWDSQRWTERFCAAGLEKDELEYAATALNAGILGDDKDYTFDEWDELIFELVARTECRACRKPKFNGELEPGSGLCTDCVS